MVRGGVDRHYLIEFVGGPKDGEYVWLREFPPIEYVVALPSPMAIAQAAVSAAPSIPECRQGRYRLARWGLKFAYRWEGEE